MENGFNIREMDSKIESLKKTVIELMDIAEDFPTLYRNCRRILASTKMLELNISDIRDLLD